jgi:hypothetical protein
VEEVRVCADKDARIGDCLGGVDDLDEVRECRKVARAGEFWDEVDGVEEVCECVAKVKAWVGNTNSEYGAERRQDKRGEDVGDSSGIENGKDNSGEDISGDVWVLDVEEDSWTEN